MKWLWNKRDFLWIQIGRFVIILLLRKMIYIFLDYVDDSKHLLWEFTHRSSPKHLWALIVYKWGRQISTELELQLIAASIEAIWCRLAGLRDKSPRCQKKNVYMSEHIKKDRKEFLRLFFTDSGEGIWAPACDTGLIFTLYWCKSLTFSTACTCKTLSKSDAEVKETAGSSNSSN